MNILNRTPPKADHRIPYGPDPLQFGDLWLPAASTAKTFPLLTFLHGGWWQSGYNLDYAGFLCQALKSQGVAVWSLEYRRVGNPGGGWPGTMQDAAAGFDFTATLAEKFPLDLNRLAAAGHSAGGHLAFWLAGRRHLPPTSVLHDPQPKLALRGVVGLAGAVDLRLTIDLGGVFQFANGKPAVASLIGGLPAEFPDRYRAANPGDLLPFGLPQILVQGRNDSQIPPALPQRWAQIAQRQGDRVDVQIVRGADHFDVVDPESKAWPVSRDALLKLLHG